MYGEYERCVKKTNEHVDKNLKCEACEVDGIQKPATAFCVDCQDYLCFDCSSYHRVPKPTKHHKVLLQHEMPGRKASTSLSEDCAKHKGETIKFYCKYHQAFGCPTCIAAMHRTCVSLQAITDFTKDLDKAPLYNEVKKVLKDMEQLFKTQKKKIQEKDQLSRRCNATTLQQVFDLLEETKQQKQLFIATVKTAVKIRVSDNKGRYENKTISAVSEYAIKFSCGQGRLFDQLEFCEFENEMQGDSESSYEQVGYSTLIEMQSTRVIAADYQWCLVVLFDCNFTKKGQLTFSTGPWDMTRTSENIVGVTLPHEKKIKFLFIHIDNRIQVVGQISAPGNCRGIAAVNDKLVVTFSNPAGIKIISGVGEVTKDILLNTTFVQLKEPTYVANLKKKLSNVSNLWWPSFTISF